MSLFVDARIPVIFDVPPAGSDVVLSFENATMHAAECSCCVARTPVATAFDQLFLDRVRGVVPWFTRVIAPDDPAVRDAVLNDPVVSARFRLG